MSENCKLSLNEWFVKKWLRENKECDICYFPNWTLGTFPIENNTKNVTEEKINMFKVVCKNCGNTKFIQENFV